jgi:nucleoside-diphosphate-sugar epimerase
MTAGHDVVGLVRQKPTPARAVKGDLKDPKTYEAAARECDAAIHTGFEYSPDGVKADKTAIDTLLAAVKGPFVYTSGIWVLGPTSGADETTLVKPAPLVAWRPAHEQHVLGAWTGKVPTSVVRPGVVFGGKGGLLEGFFEGKNFVGDGQNRWPTVHVADLADLYVRVIETSLARAENRLFHATDGTQERVADIARAVAKAAGKPEPKSWPLDEARAKLGPFADAVSMDQVIASSNSEKRLGWKPRIRGVVRNAALLAAERAAPG